MDLLDFDAQELYFDGADAAGVADLLRSAAGHYADDSAAAEAALQQAYALAPQSLNVLVALYRFYYYQHRLADALGVADEALAVIRTALAFPDDWRTLTPARLAAVAVEQRVQLRFYLFTLKAKGFLLMRMLDLANSREIFEKLVELDGQDRIGAAGLLQVLKDATGG